MTVWSDRTKPCPSVFSPISRTSSPLRRMITVLTAPMISADGASASRCSRIATLWGIEQLKPSQPIPIAPRTASPRRSGGTSQLMYRMSSPAWA